MAGRMLFVRTDKASRGRIICPVRVKASTSLSLVIAGFWTVGRFGRIRR
jgi:hypothetical protein